MRMNASLNTRIGLIGLTSIALLVGCSGSSGSTVAGSDPTTGVSLSIPDTTVETVVTVESPGITTDGSADTEVDITSTTTASTEHVTDSTPATTVKPGSAPGVTIKPGTAPATTVKPISPTPTTVRATPTPTPTTVKPAPVTTQPAPVTTQPPATDPPVQYEIPLGTCKTQGNNSALASGACGYVKTLPTGHSSTRMACPGGNTPAAEVWGASSSIAGVYAGWNNSPVHAGLINSTSQHGFAFAETANGRVIGVGWLCP